MNNLLFSINAVAPVFLIVLLGFILKRKEVLSDAFLSTATKIVFNLALPSLIFLNIAQTNFSEIFNPGMILFGVVSTLLLFLLLCLLTWTSIKDSRSRGAFIQGAFRSNYAILGLPLIMNLFGESGLAKGAILLSFMMPVYNILATVILTITSPDSRAQGKRQLYWNILKNPLIIATVAALPFALLEIRLPEFAQKSVDYLSSLTTPLALFGIGASFRFDVLKNSLRMALSASGIKIIIFPLLSTFAAYRMGYRGSDLGVLFILFSSPTAVASYIMAKAMGSDSQLAANIILITTLGSAFTIALGVFILRSIGAI